MAAYGALVSVMQIIDQLQLHPHPPITLPQKQVESLLEKVTFLQDFLERYSHVNNKEVIDLESRIAAAAYAAEDVIESHIVDQIHAGSTSDYTEKITSIDFYQGLEKVIEDLDSVMKVAMVIKDKIGVHQQDQLHRTSTISAGSSRSAPASTRQKKTEMVGFDDVLIEMLDKLTGGQPDRQIIPIVGMGGSGKTTLTRNICEHKVVTEHFDIVAWGTISQEYSIRKILVEILEDEDGDETELERKLYQKLCGRRYLVILDDIWAIEVWHLLNRFFPNNENGSRIMVTTRLSNLAFQLTDSLGLHMNFLDESKSWDLFCKLVFGEEKCPPNLKETAEIIVEHCRGLPLSIVVIGGLLANSKKRREHWEHIAENLNSIVNLEDNERCLRILYTSYNILPVYLKPCFLYIGIYPEDFKIQAWDLIMLWIAEGLLKPIGGKSLEEVGEEYLKELVERNLILAHKYTFRGRIKYCKIHDLLRDLCTREAQKHKFLCVDISPKNINTERRICDHKNTLENEYSAEILDALDSTSLARSYFSWEFQECSPSFNFKLLRVSSTYYEDDDQVSSLEPSFFQQVNLRDLSLHLTSESSSRFFSSFSLFWNLQSIVVDITPFEEAILGPSEFWNMPLLRRVYISKIKLPDPPTSTSYRSGGRDDSIVLKNLHMLSLISNFRCGEEVVKRIPNIRKLEVWYGEIDDEGSPPDHYCLDNLGQLHNLETLYLRSEAPLHHVGLNITFPHSLKKLSLGGTELKWEELTTKIGSLPHLEVLKLKNYSFIGSNWETVEGGFCRLRFLQIKECYDLEHWTTTERTHFPRLERIILKTLENLEEIPSCIGDIPTLKLINLQGCSDSADDSAKRILEEQREFGNDDLKVLVDGEEYHWSSDSSEAD